MPHLRGRILVAGGFGAGGLLQLGNGLAVLFLAAVVAVVVGTLIILYSPRLSGTVAWLLFIAQRRAPDDRLPDRPGDWRGVEEELKNKRVPERRRRMGRRRRSPPDQGGGAPA